jgi:uncharacterized repeat protein (TIGR03803 family)
MTILTHYHRRSKTRELLRFATLAIGVLLVPRAAHAQAFEVLHAFTASRVDPALPEASLMQATDGNLYGTASAGGAYGDGAVFRVTPSGGVEIVYSFQCLGPEHVGCVPRAPLIQASDGNFYGTLSTTIHQAISLPDGVGATFRLTPDGQASSLDNIGTRANPFTQAVNGTLYLPVEQTNNGFLDRWIPPDFSDDLSLHLPFFTGRVAPELGPVIQATDRALYGVSGAGGFVNAGILYKVTLSGIVTVLHEFAGFAEGAQPRSVIQAADGNFYGVAESEGVWGAHGTIFKMTPSGTFSVVHAFNGSDGSGPISPLIQTSDGRFYGTTPAGGAFDQGVVFTMTSDGTVTVLHTFRGGTADGATPMAALLQASDGNFYGTTRLGGTGIGTIFKMTPAGAFSLVASFGAASAGAGPRASLLHTADGAFYGTTTLGGAQNQGTLFRMTADGSLSAVHTFLDDSVDGSQPVAGLVQAADGAFYGTTAGTTQLIGSSLFGTVFKLSANGVFTVLHTFIGGPTDGAGPTAALVQMADGNFLGATTGGGVFGRGTVFWMTPTGTTVLLHSFGGGASDGDTPASALIRATDGNFYGTTTGGGSNGKGTIFRLSPVGTPTLLYSFSGGVDGAFPAGVIQATDGNLYGTTSSGGQFNAGTIFRLNLAGAVTTLHAFNGADGGNSVAPLLQGADGLLYGTTAGGGLYPGGAVFKMTLGGVLTVVAGLSLADGANSTAALVQAPDGTLYGTTFLGGPFGQGVIFRFDPQAVPLRPSTLVRAPAQPSGVKLTWSPVATAVSYTIRRATASGAETVLASGITGTQYADATAARGHTYYYVVSAVNASGESGASYEVSVLAGQPVSGDFNGDGKADFTVFRPSTGTWYSSGLRAPITFGSGSDVPVAGDYDGDGEADVAVFRPSNGTWYLWLSQTQTGVAFQFGNGADIPVPADYDGDGKTDLAVFRPSNGTWYAWLSRTLTGSALQFGGAGDVPVPADFDGDGKADIAVFRPSTGTWYVWQSSTQTGVSALFGATGDIPVNADYDGDGKADFAVFRPSNGTWYIWQSLSQTGLALQFGGGFDIPVPGDYDGDGRTDIAVFRPSTGTWYVWLSSTNSGLKVVYGDSSDVPIPRRH